MVDGGFSSYPSLIYIPLLLDSRATHHLTSDASNIVEPKNSFLGRNLVPVGNRTSLPINDHGFSSLQLVGSIFIPKLKGKHINISSNYYVYIVFTNKLIFFLFLLSNYQNILFILLCHFFIHYII